MKKNRNKNNDNKNNDSKILKTSPNSLIFDIERDRRDRKKSKEFKKYGKLDPVSGDSIVLWAVIDNEVDPHTPITYTATRKDALIALDQYLYINHYIHFRNWCDVHSLPVNHGKSWEQYANIVLASELDSEQAEYDAASAVSDTSPATRYTVARVTYTGDTIASLLRSVDACIPMGCPFEHEEELNSFSAYLAEKSEQVDEGTAAFSPFEVALCAMLDDITECEEGEEDDEDNDDIIPSTKCDA